MLAALALVAAIITIFALLAPVLTPLGNLNLLIFFVFVVGVMVFAAVPIAFAFGVASVCYSHAISDMVNLEFFIWKEAGGNVRH